MTIPDPKASPCIAATAPSACAFSCRCNSPECGCDEHCNRHADAILAHRAKPKHKLHDLALSAYHPSD
jgi:hypothetical protein